MLVFFFCAEAADGIYAIYVFLFYFCIHALRPFFFDLVADLHGKQLDIMKIGFLQSPETLSITIWGDVKKKKGNSCKTELMILLKEYGDSYWGDLKGNGGFFLIKNTVIIFNYWHQLESFIEQSLFLFLVLFASVPHGIRVAPRLPYEPRAIIETGPTHVSLQED